MEYFYNIIFSFPFVYSVLKPFMPCYLNLIPAVPISVDAG